jgi:hypothetical protein
MPAAKTEFTIAHHLITQMTDWRKLKVTETPIREGWKNFTFQSNEDKRASK